ncbi:putative 50S ribosomal protein L6 [Candidatus Tremblaya princeps PCIT]|uniref:50S ribosomal protein L6 n=1 Tax=Tremblaya princeps (strain PCIT) TaxID=891398 RepID=F7XYJ6_TREPP|nr:putative 50S ribosomal protein L6 [Candidatus Tremblaya princeps PCIT]
MSCRRAIGPRQRKASALAIPSGCSIAMTEGALKAWGAGGSMSIALSASVSACVAGGCIQIEQRMRSTRARGICGTTIALIANMARGVVSGHSKTIILSGVGYRLELRDCRLTMFIGYSHPVQYAVPEGLVASLPSPTELTISGTDKQRVGEAAAQVRRHRPMEPYKGKGFRYADEAIRLRVRRRSK